MNCQKIAKPHPLCKSPHRFVADPAEEVSGGVNEDRGMFLFERAEYSIHRLLLDLDDRVKPAGLMEHELVQQ